MSLRRILAITLVLLATVPALLVATLLGRAANASVEELAGRQCRRAPGTAARAVGTDAHRDRRLA